MGYPYTNILIAIIVLIIIILVLIYVYPHLNNNYYQLNYNNVKADGYYKLNSRRNLLDINIAIISGCTLQGRDFARISIKRQQEYASIHGYDYYFIDFDKEKEYTFIERVPQWYKLKIIAKFLADYDYVMWIDDDACFVNYNYYIEDIIMLADGRDFIVTKDLSPVSTINSGVMILKNSPYNHNILRQAIAGKPDEPIDDIVDFSHIYRDGMKDQECLEILYGLHKLYDSVHNIRHKDIDYALLLKNGIPYLDEHVCLLHQDVMNGTNSPFIIHLAGYDNSTRLKYLQQIENGQQPFRYNYIFPWNDDFKFVDRQIPATLSGRQTKIPKIIHQTFNRNFLVNNLVTARDSWMDKNPDYQHNYYTDDDCRQFIAANFSAQVLAAYDKLIPEAYKADLWRYCQLYINGGVYIDIKFIASASLSRYIDELTDLLFIIDVRGADNKHGMYNAMFACCPKHPLIKRLIDTCVEQIQQNYYGSNMLDITGPAMMGRVLAEQGYIFTRAGNYNIHNNNIVVLQHIGEYRIVDPLGHVCIYTRDIYNSNSKNRNFFHNITGKKHYSDYWLNQCVYHK